MDYISYIRSKVGHEKVILVFAGGILADQQGRVLLQLRGDKGTWGIIGGALELGESSVDALKREFMEETGISVVPKRLLNVYSDFEDSYPNGDIAQTVVIAYEVEAIEAYDIQGFHNEETLKLGFFSQEEIKDLTLVNAQHQLMLEEYFADRFEMGK